MIWPTEYEERVKVKGFSILDDDFDVMAGDLCSVVGEESGIAATWTISSRLKPPSRKSSEFSLIITGK